MARHNCVALILILSASSAYADDAERRARIHFQVGRQLVQHAEYEKAVKEFGEGYDAMPRPQFLFNMGICYRQMKMLPRARAMFERFLSEVEPSDPARLRVAKWVAELDELLAPLSSMPTDRAARSPSTTLSTTRQDGPRQDLVGAPVPVLEHPPTPPSVTVPAPKASAETRRPERSFARTRWWIFPVAGVVVAGAALGIYFAVRAKDPCAGYPSCVRF